MTLRETEPGAETEPRTPPAEAAPPSAPAVASWPAALADRPAEELLRWALGRFRRRLALLTSFQAEGMVLLDMAWRIDPSVRVVTLDTGRLPEETFGLIDRIHRRYGIEVEVEMPDPVAVAELVQGGGPNLFYNSVAERQRCCHVRKVVPLRRALAGLEAWVTGMRRGQAPSRAGIGRIELDRENGGLVKLNPLADWSWRRVWEYLGARDVPYHPLYDRGFRSIGCAPCTRSVGPGQDPRAGRWWWEDGEHKECGLHLTADGGPAERGPAERGPAERGPAERGTAERGIVERGTALPVVSG